MRLPGPVSAFFNAVRGVSEWEEALQRGALPDATVTWPEEVGGWVCIVDQMMIHHRQSMLLS